MKTNGIALWIHIGVYKIMHTFYGFTDSLSLPHKSMDPWIKTPSLHTLLHGVGV